MLACSSPLAFALPDPLSAGAATLHFGVKLLIRPPFACVTPSRETCLEVVSSVSVTVLAPPAALRPAPGHARWTA